MYRTRVSSVMLGVVVAASLLLSSTVYASTHPKSEHGSTGDASMMSSAPRGGLLMPMMDPARGRKVFAAKGCVVCHAINGVGGNHGPQLDMSRMGPMNPFEFAAKMWRGAEAMAVLQQEELGETIELTGQDLADIVAFVHSAEEVGRFSEADVPHKILDVLKRTHGEKGGHAHKEGSAGRHKD